MKKKAVVAVIIVVIVILIIVAVFLFIRGSKPKDGEKIKDEGSGDLGGGTGAGSSPSPGGAYGPYIDRCTNDAFPLGVGSSNQCVVALQRALGISQVGKFGPQTKAAVNAKGFVVPLTHADFDKIIGMSPATWRPGDAAYLKGFNTQLSVYVKASAYGLKKIGEIKNYFTASKRVGAYEGKAFLDGYSNILLDNSVAGERNVIVKTSEISRTA